MSSGLGSLMDVSSSMLGFGGIRIMYVLHTDRTPSEEWWCETK
ncbi:hypothetical protein ACFRQM_34230 [Streptomyces sp. NPDC056831]